MEEVDKPAKVAKTKTSESKAIDFSAKMEEKKDKGQATDNSSLETHFVSKEKKSFECLRGSSHKFSRAKIVLSQVNVDITSNIDTMQVQPDKSEGSTVGFVKNNDPASLIYEEIETENTCSSSDQVNNSSNKSHTLKDEQTAIYVTTKELGNLQTNSQSKESKENATTSEVFTEATKSQVSEHIEKLGVNGLLQEPSECDQSELANFYTVEADSKVNEVTNGSANSNETKDNKTMQNNGPSEAPVANKEKVQENSVCLQVISSTPNNIVNHTEICSAETYYDHPNVETEKHVHVDTVTRETKTKVVDAEKNRTENIENKSDVTESVAPKAVYYEADQISEINNPNLQDRTAEEIYLQSTDPVNTEINSDSDHHKDADSSETDQIYLEDTEYPAVPETNETYTDTDREGNFQSQGVIIFDSFDKKCK